LPTLPCFTKAGTAHSFCTVFCWCSRLTLQSHTVITLQAAVAAVHTFLDWGIYPFLVEIVDFANPTVFYKSWHSSEYLYNLLVVFKTHPSVTHCHHITSNCKSVAAVYTFPDWRTYPFLVDVVDFANPTVFYKT